MPSVGLEPTISVLERAKTIHALDGVGTVIGTIQSTLLEYFEIYIWKQYLIFFCLNVSFYNLSILLLEINLNYK
jgi:hypothetical protein